MQIKQFELPEKDKLLAFLQTVYADNPRMSDASFWDWHFLKNPYVEADNLPVWIAKDGDEIVGQLAATPVKLQIGKEKKAAIWILDLIVHSDYRGKGIAKKLVLAAEEFCLLGLGVNTNEQTAPILLQKLGWKIVSKIPRYNKLLFPGEALREISQINPARRLANFCYAPLRPRLKKNFFGKNKRLRLVDEFDSSFDDLWSESAAQWSCGVAREPELLRWQYQLQPEKKFHVLGFYESDKLLGYAVLFFRRRDASGALPKAAITDLCYHPSKPIETIDELLRGALQLALERRAGTLVTDAMDSTIEERLKFFGFSRVKNPLQLMVKSN
jgi:GNAT superfamily N-acetyltransferase